MHRNGTPLSPSPAVKADDASSKEDINRPSLALFDRREQEYVAVSRLPLPQMHDGSAAGEDQPGSEAGSLLPVPCSNSKLHKCNRQMTALRWAFTRD